MSGMMNFDTSKIEEMKKKGKKDYLMFLKMW